jgi:hypothetical protein
MISQPEAMTSRTMSAPWNVRRTLALTQQRALANDESAE